MALKQAEAEDGFIFRACDFSGAAGTLKLTLPKPAMETLSCGLVEANARTQPQGRGETVTLPVRAFSPVTLKVRFEPVPSS